MAAEKKIVFVDDDPNWSYILPELGEILGYRIESVQTVDKCLAYISDNPDVELLITDIRMPGKSGYELIEQFKRDYPDKSVMIITAYETNKLEKFIDREQIRSYLLKPFSVEDFENSMKFYFG